MPASCAATDITNTGASSGTCGSAMTLLHAARGGGDARPWVVCAGPRGILLARLASLTAELLRPRHLDGDEQVAVATASLADTAAADSKRPPAGRAGRHLDRNG